jgi:hypothetical protein
MNRARALRLSQLEDDLYLLASPLQTPLRLLTSAFGLQPLLPVASPIVSFALADNLFSLVPDLIAPALQSLSRLR